MPNRRPTGRSVARVQQGRLTPSYEDRTGVPTVGCVANDRCPHPVLDDAPVPLCGKHVREVYQFAQGVIEDQLLIAAASAID